MVVSRVTSVCQCLIVCVRGEGRKKKCNIRRMNKKKKKKRTIEENKLKKNRSIESVWHRVEARIVSIPRRSSAGAFVDNRTKYDAQDPVSSPGGAGGVRGEGKGKGRGRKKGEGGTFS